MQRRSLLALAAVAPMGLHAQAGFDHRHTAWDTLLKRHVRWLPDGVQSRVDYRGFAADRAALGAVLEAMASVGAAAFAGWTGAQQRALLINAYNAATIELILTRWPDLASIKDLGSIIRSPWKIRFVSLFGELRHLDWIEHEQLRARWPDPRIHAAVNCASIGCPALRPEAFTADALEAQLDDGLRRFLGDRTRNRVRAGRLEVSAIFKWYREDFGALDEWFARQATALTGDAAEQAKLRQRQLPITFLDYDWSLNATGR